MATAARHDAFLQREAQTWLDWDPNASTRATVEATLERQDKSALEAYFGSGRLEFGTAGLRAKMGPGYSAMNDLTVIQTTQGLAKVLEEEFGDARAKEMGVVIGYDHRAEPTSGISSERLALASAAVLLHRGFKVLLFRGFVPTPLVPFAIQQHKCCAGVMVTASHNPKQDNGYKLYWDDAVQIISPIDSRVAAAILSSLTPSTTYRYDDASLVRAHPSCLDVTDMTMDAYFSELVSKLRSPPMEEEGGTQQRGSSPSSSPQSSSGAKVVVVYTPMHGVGQPFVSRAFEALGLPPFTPVPSQQDPDPAFPTVRFPNPEERGALDHACAVGDELIAAAAHRPGGGPPPHVVVLANDPDADRMAIAERRQEDGGWHVFTGNEIGTLLGCWRWEQWRRQHPQADPSQAVVVCSTVSSKMLRAVAQAEGFQFHETLTGFKWLGHKALDLRLHQGNKHLLLAYEEAIGYCLGDIIADKDGISAAVVAAEMAKELLHERGLTLLSYLSSLHAKYGEFVSSNHYFFLPPPPQTAKVVADIFARLRDGGRYWQAVGPYRIKAIRDLGAPPGYDSSTADKRPTLPVSSSTNMLTLEFVNGCVLTLRTSGTEPKLKYYSEMQGRPGVAREVVEGELRDMMAVVLQELVQPDKHGLT